MCPPFSPECLPYTLVIQDACKYSGLSRATIYRLANQGDLELIKVGRRTLVRRADLERCLEEKAKEAAARVRT